MLFVMNLIIVSGMFVCSSFLIGVCMFIVSKALLISSATVIVRAGGTWGKWDMCLCFGCRGVGGVGAEWMGGLS